MALKQDGTTRCREAQSMIASRVFAIIIVICLVECAAEHKFNSRDKPSNLVARINGWRSQRGGSCLSYGHSCWGAHGKRSGKPPVAAPDWYLTRILRRMAASAEMNNENQANTRDDLSDIFQKLSADTAPSDTTDKLDDNNEDGSIIDLPLSRTMDAKPMLDEDMLSKVKMWQIMKESSEEN